MTWFRRWWGQDDADFNASLGLEHHYPHWSARAVRASLGFFKREWKWVVGITIAVIGLAIKLI